MRAAGREKGERTALCTGFWVICGIESCAFDAGNKGRRRSASAWERIGARNVDRHVEQLQFREIAEVHWNMGGAGTLRAKVLLVS